MGKVYTKNKRVIYREEGEGAFLFDPGNGNLKYMNRMGKEMFLILDGSRDIDQVVRAFLERYPEIVPDRMRMDIESFFDQLSENQFVASMDPAPIHSNNE